MSKKINLKLKLWRQKDKNDAGKFETYEAKGIDTDCSFLEMLDVVNEGLTKADQEPIAFDHDCREGICGSCSMSSRDLCDKPAAALFMRTDPPMARAVMMTFLRTLATGVTSVGS